MSAAAEVKVWEVIVASGQRWEIEATQRDLDGAIEDGLVLWARVPRLAAYDWRMNAAQIVAYTETDKPPTSPTPVSVMAPTIGEDEYERLGPEQQGLYEAIPEDESPTLDRCFRLHVPEG